MGLSKDLPLRISLTEGFIAWDAHLEMAVPPMRADSNCKPSCLQVGDEALDLLILPDFRLLKVQPLAPQSVASLIYVNTVAIPWLPRVAEKYVAEYK